MAMRDRPKAWADRLALDDIRGLRLLAAAIYHAEMRADAPASLEGAQPAPENGRPKPSAPRATMVPDAARPDRSELRLWRARLDQLGASEAEIAAGATATLQDFRFDPADLWRHQRLAMFVVDCVADCWPALDRTLPICGNDDLRPQDDLIALFDEYWLWHAAPADAKPSRNVGFDREIAHLHWRNYLAPYCEAPRGRGQPEGPRWLDGRSAAARYAWSLLASAADAQPRLSIAEAVRRAVACFTLLGPRDPEPPRRDAEDFIRAVSRDQAEKAVRKLLTEMIAQEKPERQAQR